MSTSGSPGRHLLLSKYLYTRGTAILRDGGIFDPGLAVSLFQDAAEIALLACATQFHASYSDSTPFLKVWDATDGAATAVGKPSIPMRPDMQALNKARVTFKHHAERVDRAAAETHRINVLSFLTLVGKLYLDLDFKSLSLVTFVQEESERSPLEAALNDLRGGNRQSALVKCAEALRLMMERNATFFEHGLLVSFAVNDQPMKTYVDHQIAHLRNHIRDVEGLVHSAMYGVPPMDFMLLRQILPTIRGTEVEFQHWGHELISDETVERGIEILAQFSIGMSDRHAAVRKLLPGSEVFF
jgi:hypothetical protein